MIKNIPDSDLEMFAKTAPNRKHINCVNVCVRACACARARVCMRACMSFCNLFEAVSIEIGIVNFLEFI